MEKLDISVLVDWAERKIVISGQVTDNTQEHVNRALMFFQGEAGKEIIIFIDSFGGGIASSTQLFDVIRASHSPVTCVVMGKVASAAFVILQACGKRVIYPNGEVMNHAPALISLRTDTPDLDTRIMRLREKHEQFLQYLLLRAKVSIDQLKKWSVEQKYLSAQEALNAGLVDEIYIPQATQS